MHSILFYINNKKYVSNKILSIIDKSYYTVKTVNSVHIQKKHTVRNTGNLNSYTMTKNSILAL